jgi:hypothetical protein
MFAPASDDKYLASGNSGLRSLAPANQDERRHHSRPEDITHILVRLRVAQSRLIYAQVCVGLRPATVAHAGIHIVA